MNRVYEALTQYAGQVPVAAPVYRPANVFGGGDITPSAFGVAFYQGAVPLDSLHGVDAFVAHRAVVQDRLAEIDRDAAGQPFSEEQQAEFAELVETRGTLDKSITELNARARLVTEGAADPKKLELPTLPGARPSARRTQIPENIHDVADYRNFARTFEDLPALYKEGAKRFLDGVDKDKAHAIEHLMGKVQEDKPGAFALRLLECGSAMYEESFRKYLANVGLSPREQAALGTYSNSGADGGYAIPVLLDPTIIPTADVAVSDIRTIARVVQITGKEWNGVTSGGITASRVGENSAITPTSPALAQPRIVPTAVKVAIPFSVEVDGDWGSLRTEMTREIAEAKANEEATTFTTGTGDGATGPQGIERMADTSIIWTQASGNFGVEDVYACETDTGTGASGNALPSRFRQGASFLANKSIYNKIRQFSVGTVGEGSIWVRGIAAGRPNELIGYPAYENSAMDATVTNGNDILILGQFNPYFTIVDRVGMSVELVPHMVDGSGNLLGQRAIFAFWRNGSKVLSSNAFRKLRVGEGS